MTFCRFYATKNVSNFAIDEFFDNVIMVAALSMMRKSPGRPTNDRWIVLQGNNGMLNRAILCVVAAAGTFALVPSQAQAQDRDICNGSSGPAGFFNTSDGVSRGFYTWFTYNASSNDCLKLKANGVRRFVANWTLSGNGSDAVGGMGWDVGTSNRVMKYKILSMSGLTGKLSIGSYGWTCNTKKVEYYIIDSYNGSYVPWDPARNANAIPIKWGTGALRKIDTDGGKYLVYKTTRTNAGNACGANATFDQYWSVRETPLPASTTTTNTITFANHVSGWAGMGLTLGTFGKPATGRAYQVIGVEGLNTSNGSVEIDIE